MAKYLLCASMLVMLVMLAGCYREPTNPVQVKQNEADQKVAGEPVMPQDDIHAGVMSAPPAASAAPGEIIEARDVEIGSSVLTAPSDWVRRKAGSMFLITEFALPKVEGDAADGRLTVSSAMGSIADNIERWRGQFGGKPDKESQETFQVGDAPITWVDFSGTFADGFASTAPKTGYRMLAAVIPIGDQQIFVKGYGPEKTVAAHADRIRAFVQSLRAKGEAAPTPTGQSQPAPADPAPADPAPADPAPADPAPADPAPTTPAPTTPAPADSAPPTGEASPAPGDATPPATPETAPPDAGGSQPAPAPAGGEAPK